MSDKHHEKKEMAASRKLLTLAGIEFVQHKPKVDKVLIDFSSIDK